MKYNKKMKFYMITFDNDGGGQPVKEGK